MYTHTTNILFNIATEQDKIIKYSAVLPLYSPTPEIELQKVFDSIKNRLKTFFINIPDMTIYHKNEYLAISALKQECEVLVTVKVAAMDLKEHYRTLLKISPNALVGCFKAAL
ncbi:MAG: hypothetical protein ACI4V7_06455 [Succinivibrionaceae bacterium]